MKDMWREDNRRIEVSRFGFGFSEHKHRAQKGNENY